MNKNKKYSIGVLLITALCLFAVGITIFAVDPYFHYRYPNLKLSYEINNQRYQNDGITRHFEYDAIITGTSMSENFKTSQFDELFGVKSIKVPYSGGSYKENCDSIKRALEYNPKIKKVICSIDYSRFYTSKDHIRYESYPEYLYNKNTFDDVHYLLNKSVLFQEVLNKLEKGFKKKTEITSFDESYNWSSRFSYGKAAILKTYKRSAKVQSADEVTPDEIEKFQQNIDLNLVDIAEKNPDVQFYYFITPYSVLWWDQLNQENRLDKFLYGEKMIIESLVQYENVHLFSFSNDYDIVTNLNNYKDRAHYSENINSYMLQKMSNDENRLTYQNYQAYLENIYSFYKNYDYDSIYK